MMSTIDIKSVNEIDNQRVNSGIVIIDSTVENYQSLIAGVLTGYKAVVLDASRDGIKQISEVLATHRKISSLHIVSHGNPGSLQLGATDLNRNTLANYADQIRNWANSLTEKANILLYGCNVAADEQGKTFVRRLSELTEADIAASEDLTGNKAEGGNWNLEFSTGAITKVLAFEAEVLNTYSSTLGELTNGNAFLKGQYVEFGIGPDGAFGSDTSAPAGYHPRGNTKLGFVANPKKDNWATKDGDFFLPGSPEEGWGVKVNGFSYNNNNTIATPGIAGSLSNFVSTATQESVNWSGSASGLKIDQTYSIAKNGLYIDVNVSMTNTTGTNMSNVYYMRNVDPDNNQTVTGNFVTTNTIISQPDAVNSVAEVKATQADGSFVSLVGYGPNARVTSGGFSNRDAQAVFSGSSGFIQSGSRTGDEAISLAYKFDNINAGQTANFHYRYILVDSAKINNHAPTVANPIVDSTAVEDAPFSFSIPASTFTDSDSGDSLTYTASRADGSALPAWISFNPDTRTFSGTPANGGVLGIKVTATDSAGSTVSDVFDLAVAEVNDAPTVANAIANRTATEDTPLTFQFAANTFSDVDAGDSLTYSAQLNDGSALPNWLKFNAATRTFSGTPTNESVGTLGIKVIATDKAGATANTNFNLAIANVNDAPVVANPMGVQSVTEDTPFSYQIPANTFIDVDAGDSLTYSAKLSDGSALPSWLSFDAATRTFTGNPPNESVGYLDIKVTVKDKAGATANTDFSLSINNVNDAPFVANPISNQNATEDTPFSFQFAANTFSDIDLEDFRTYTAQLSTGEDLPSWLSFDAETRTFSGTPENSAVGNVSIKVVATDAAGATAESTFDLAVANVNDTPVVTNPMGTQNVTEDAPFSFEVPENTFSDADAGDSLTYTAQLSDGEDLPKWLSFDAETRTFSGTPANDHVGNLSIKVTATDSAGTSVDSTFDIAVANANDAPVAAHAIDNQNATEDAAFSFEVPEKTFSDVDAGDSLTYSAQLSDGEDLPSWLSFDADTRTFSGTPENSSVGNVSIKVVATDSAGATAESTFDLAVANTNDTPVVANPMGIQNVTEDAAFSFKVPANTFSDVDAGDSLTYSAKLSDGKPLPAWLSFDAETRTFSGTPTNSNVGNLSIKVIATDSDGANVGSTFDLAVANTNDAPTVDHLISLQNATEELPFEFELPNNTFSDLDVGDSLTYSVSLIGGEPLPEWLSFDAETMSFSGTPGNDDVGNIGINVVATDKSGATANTDFAIAVANVNDAPDVENLDKSGIDAKIVQFSLGDFTSHFTDIDNDTLTKIKITSLPTNGKLKVGNAEVKTNQEIEVAKLKDLYFAPDFKFKGNLSFDWNGFDGTTYAEEDAKVKMTIDSGNHLPFVVIGKPMATEDSLFNYTVDSEFFDDLDIPDGDSLSYTATLQNGAPLPDWLSFDPETLALTGTPDNDDVGKFRVKITATDTYGDSTSGLLKVEVKNSNDAPTLADSITDLTTTEDTPFSFSVPADTFADVDLGDSFTYTATLEDGSKLPEWLSFDSATRTFSGTPENSAVGNIVVKVMATDTAGASVSDNFNLEVVNINDAPMVGNEVTKQMVAEDAPYSFTLPENTFIDVDPGDSLTYSATLADGSGLPEWLSFDPETNTFSGNPGNDVVGTFAIKVTVVDQSGTVVSHTFDLEVENTNDAPVLHSAIADLTIDEDASFSFAVPADTFADADLKDSLTYSATLKDGSDLPEWLTFDSETNTFSGTPVNGDVGELEVTVTATDNSGEKISDDFTLEVENTNDAPVLHSEIADLTTDEDASFSFAVPADTFADADLKDSLTYSATLKDGSDLPEWLTFDSETNTFSGTPVNGDVGELEITVTATDDSGEKISDDFTLEVVNTSDAPVLHSAIADLTTDEDASFSFAVPADTFADADLKDSLTYSATLKDGSDLPEWLTFDSETNTFSGTPVNGDVGELEITVTATDDSGEKISDDFTLEVVNTNDAPVVANPMPQVISTDEDAAFSLTLPEDTFADVDAGDHLSYSMTLEDGDALPEWLSFDPETNTFSGTPSNDEVGELEITVTATDDSEASVSNTFQLKVVNTNDAPILAKPVADQTITEDALFSFAVDGDTFSDVDAGDKLTYVASLADGSDLPEWLTFDAEALAFSSVDSAPEGNYELKITATDTSAASAEAVFNLNIDLTNVINGTSANEQFATTHKKDLISAAGGNDAITATLANLQQKDVINGETGTDTFNLTSGVAADHVEIDLTDSGNQLLSIADTVVSNFERFDFSSFAGTTDFQGATKADFILAGKGADALAGDAGNDILTGNAGNDSIIGGTGNDTLTGNAGDDFLSGGTGSDRFVFDINKAFSDSLMGSDQITDFAPSADKIVLDLSTFKSLTSIAGTGFSVASEFAVVNNDAALATSKALITYNSSSGALAYNQNGAADGFGTGDDQFALLENNPTLVANSFMIQA